MPDGKLITKQANLTTQLIKDDISDREATTGKVRLDRLIGLRMLDDRLHEAGVGGRRSQSDA